MYKIIDKKKLLVTTLADFIGKLIFYPKKFIIKQEPIDVKQVRQILIIRTAYIGDVMMTVPILKPLKEKFNGAHITFLTSNAAHCLLIGNPYVDRIITFDPFWFYRSSIKAYIQFINSIKTERYDLIIEARADIRDLMFIVYPLRARYKISYSIGGGEYFLTHNVPYVGLKHKVDFHLDLVKYLSCNTQKVDWAVYLSDDERQTITNIMNRYGIDTPFIACHPGARLPLKIWPTTKCATLYDIIAQNLKKPLVIFGSYNDKPIIAEIVSLMTQKAINLAGKINLRQLSGILKKAALFICNDSAPMHIAASVQTPTVAIFGPSKSVETAPYGNIHRIVEKDFACRYSCTESVCKFKRYHACMTDISVYDVFHQVEDILKELNPNVQNTHN
ncbi:MAG: glycosyltransferase family 9 protein [Candidatus Magnetoovum sp. WYHC-5]|nr:glycosyltransferase family 9 protein [Candidatus Magnetoovum sp. WYHC-5]